MSESTTSWWAPVRRGLVVDPVGKHYRAMGISLWLFLHLVLHADRPTGVVRRKQETIAKEMSVSLRTVRDWLHRLEQGGYITIVRTGRAMSIQLHRWQPPGRKHAGVTGKGLPIRPAKMVAGGEPDHRNREVPGGETAPGAPYDKSLSTRFFLQQHSGSGRSPALDGSPPGGLRTRRSLLGEDLATGLDDREHLSRYLGYASRYPEGVLRRLLSEARAVPDEHIKRSRPALFRYLLNQYDHHTPEDPRD